MNTQTLSQSSVTVKSNTAIRVVVGVLLSLLSGVMLTAAFAPYDAWPLVFVAFIPMILAQYRIFPAKVSSLGGGDHDGNLGVPVLRSDLLLGRLHAGPAAHRFCAKFLHRKRFAKIPCRHSLPLVHPERRGQLGWV